MGNFKLQASNAKPPVSRRSLPELGSWSLLGAWVLGLGACCVLPSSTFAAETKPPLPPPVPPQYTKLKDLHLTTQIVRDGRPAIRIVAPASRIYDTQATRLQTAIEKLTGCKVPIIRDDAPEAAVPIEGSLIVLGNRSTNATISELYNRYFLLTDLRYPGAGGFEVRTIHNPFGGGHNVILVGASDAKGVEAATNALIAKLKAAASRMWEGPQRPDHASGLEKGSRGAEALPTFKQPARPLSVGWLMEIKLGDGIVVPRGVRELETWEASAGYRSSGYFGWNSISKRMAAYYMTGDAFHAREALRLAFPDKQAFREITEIDGEMIENKDDPLAGPYHYTAHMMILFWDLIEESAVFSDEERLKVTNAFARQLTHRKDEGIYRLTRPPPAVGSRHGQWSAISLYCLGRYFNRDYTDPVWAQCVRGAQLAFAPLHEHAWVAGENDNLFWYCTAITPVFTYMLLSGDREPMRNGVAAKLLRDQELLISGRVPDWALNFAALDFLHKAAYLTQDGRWLAYRDRTGVDTTIFRLGHSFWPGDKLKPAQPTDLVGKWTINHLPKPHWLARNNGLPPEESFQNASFRSATDAGGDFILIDGFNGASRNSYHTFALLELRLAGRTILQGYLNQMLTKADGMVEARVAMDAALRHADVIGQTAFCVGETPKAAFCNWRRTLAQRVGRHALVVDDLTFRADSENMEAQFKWEMTGGPVRFDAKTGALTAGASRIWCADALETTIRGGIATQEWNGAVKQGQHRIFFSLIGSGIWEGPRRPDQAVQGTAADIARLSKVETHAPAGHVSTSESRTALRCARLTDNAAALALPQPAVAVVGEWKNCQGELVILGSDHLHGKGLTRAGLGQPLLEADAPVDVDWDFATGALHVIAARPTQLRIGLAEPKTLSLPAGRHTLDGGNPASSDAELSALLAEANAKRAKPVSPATAKAPAPPSLAAAFTANVGDAVTDLIAISSDKQQLTCAAEGNTIHLLGADGRELRLMRTDGKIRQLHWWPEHKLLLAGCADEKVCAFDLAGARKWTFVSEMDPAVFRAAKQYWFKTAPGHEGIHGVSSGVFLDGKSQAFVGSACTLEIIDENGRLVKRLPQFWGTVHKFALVPGAAGSVNLLASRKITDRPSLGVINNRTLDPTPRSFDGVPAGHTHVGGWMDQTRHHIFVDDLDGDGKQEVVSEITGAWNRVTVWDLQGRPLHNVQFGPSPRGGGGDIRDLDVGDLEGDGRKEIVVALSNGLVVALNHRCEKWWSKRLGSPPAVLKVAGGLIIVASDDGRVLLLDPRGNIAGQGKLHGRPARVQKLATTPHVVLATDQGEVKAIVAGQ